MKKQIGIGIGAAVVIIAALAFVLNEPPEENRSFVFTNESDQEITSETTSEGTDYSVSLSETVGIKNPWEIHSICLIFFNYCQNGTL